MEDQLIYSFRKNQSEEIRISLKEYEGKLYLDLRIFFKPKGAEAFLPKKKGLRISTGLLNELRQGIEKAEEALSVTQ